MSDRHASVPEILPLVSVLIPAWNVAPWIGECLQSVLSQSLVNFECIVVDDGSTDDTACVVQSFADPRIRLVSQVNAGVSAARNTALEAARGAFVAFLDADDLWHPQALEWMLAPLLEDPDCGLTWADFLRFEDATGRVLPLPGTRLQHTGTPWLDMLVDNFMQFGAICLRTDAIKRQLFDTSLVIGEDRDWLLRVLKGLNATYVPRTVHYYRQRADSAMRDCARFLKDEERVLQRHLLDPDVPQRIRRRALSALDFHGAVLLAKTPGGLSQAIARYCRAVFRDPLYLENYLRPLRKLWFRLRPQYYSIGN